MEVVNRYDNGNVRMKCETNAEGIKDGICKEYYKDGSLFILGNWKDGKQDGKLIKYFKNGNIKGVQFFKNGAFDGKVILYHKNGEVKHKGRFKNGLKTGFFKTYDSTGDLDYKREYVIVEDTNEHVNQLLDFNNKGDTLNRSYYYKIRKNQDTIHLNDSLKVKITIKPLHDSIKVFYGGYNKDYKIIDSSKRKEIDGTNLKANFHVKPNKSGENEIRGEIWDYKIDDSVLWYHAMYFNLNFYAKSIQSAQ